MKKTTISMIAIALCVLLTAFSLCACGDNNSGEKGGKASLVGSWEYESGGYTYTFNEDGTGSYDAAGKEMDFTYTDNGDSITFSYEDTTEPSTYDYRIEDEVLYIKDSLDNDVKYIKK